MQMMVGQLRVAGVPNVAGVMGDVVGQVQAERGPSWSARTNTGVDHLQVADRMARVMGVTPQETGGSPIQRDLARFGLFVDQALRLGLTPTADRAGRARGAVIARRQDAACNP